MLTWSTKAVEPKTTHRIHMGLEMQAELTLLVATPYLGKISFDFRVQVDFCPVHPVSHSDECYVIPILIGSYSSCRTHFLELVLTDCLDLTFQPLAPWFFCFFFTHIFSGIYFHKYLKSNNALCNLQEKRRRTTQG